MDKKTMTVSGKLDETLENKKNLYDAILKELKDLWWNLPETSIAYSFSMNNETGEVLIFVTNSEKYVAVDIENNIQV